MMKTTGTTGGAPHSDTPAEYRCASASARAVDETPKTVKTVDQTEAAPMFAAPTKPGLPRYLWNAVHHFRTINRHKREVMKNCFRVGLYKQGLLHDLSKYSWAEFKTGVKYYQGYRSPNTAERLETGLCEAWLHHKGRNKHHFEYWVDYDTKKKATMVGCRMPYRYVAEMFCDRVAASKVYKGADYDDSCPWEYFQPCKDSPLLEPETRREITELLWMLKTEGEEKTFAYLKKEIARRRREKDHF